MNSENDATNDQIDGFTNVIQEKAAPCINATTSQKRYNTNVGISLKKIATYDTVENSKQTLFTIQIQSLSALLTQNIECLLSLNIPNLSLTDEKFESCIQDKCFKPHNQVNIFSNIFRCPFQNILQGVEKTLTRSTSYFFS